VSADSVQGFRVAIRECEDGWVRAYLAKPHTMDDALCVAAISLQMCQLDEAAFDQFKTLCRLIAGAVTVDTFGVAPTRIDEQKANSARGGPAA